MIRILFPVILSLITSVAAFAFVPTSPEPFEANSANLSNKYYPYVPGDTFKLKGYGTLSEVTIAASTSTEVVDGVNCLRMTLTAGGGIDQMWSKWLAQDADENVWLLKTDESGVQVCGKDNPILVMPGNPEMNDSWTGDADELAKVISLNAEYEPYTELLLLESDYGGGDLDFEYYSPHRGIIRIVMDDDGETNG